MSATRAGAAADLYEGVVGQEEAVAFLRASAERPVHAYLFHGPPGSGKQAAARAFAAALVCPDGGCGACGHCRRALAGTHPDLVEIERTGASLGVDDARRLVAIAQRRPLEAARQVLVVHDVHLATRSAPALLKTVEEPPTTTVFVLLADDVPPELATVASRCVEVAFPPLQTATVEAWLAGRGVEPERAALIAQASGGNLDRARLLADDPGFSDRLALWRSVPSRLDGTGARAGALARELLASADAALEPLRAEHARAVAAAEEAASALGERGLPGRKELVDRQHREERRWRTDELRTGLGVLARTYRDAAVAASHDAAAGEAASRAVRAVACISEAAGSLRRNPNETLLLEALLLRLGALDPSAP